MSNTFAVRAKLMADDIPRGDFSCPGRGKVAYRNRHDASRVAAEMNQNFKNKKRRGIERKSPRWAVFQCEHCDAWHVGRRPMRTEFTRKNHLEAFQ